MLARDDASFSGEPEPGQADEPDDAFDPVAAGLVVDEPDDADLFEPAARAVGARDGLPDLDDDDWWYDDEDPLFAPIADADTEGVDEEGGGWWASRSHRLLVAAAGALAAVVLVLVLLGGGGGDESVTTAQRPITTRPAATTSTLPATTTTAAPVVGGAAVETTDTTRPPSTARASNTRPRSTVTPPSTDAPPVDPPTVVPASNPPPTNPPPTNPPPTTTTTQPLPPLPTGSIAITPSSAVTGYNVFDVVLSWDSSGADTVTVTGPGVNYTAKAGSVALCPSDLNGDTCDAPGDPGGTVYTYTLTVTNAAGSQQYFATLTIHPAPGP